MKKIIRYSYPICLFYFLRVLSIIWIEIFLQGEKIKPHSDFQLIFQLVLLSVTSLVAFGAIYYWGDRSIFKWPKIKVSYLLATIGLYFFLQAFNHYCGQWFPHHITENQQALDDIVYAHPSAFAWGSHLFILSLLGPLREELIFRGVFMTSYFKGSKYFLDVFVSAAAFSYFHMIGFAWSWIDFFVYLVAGLVVGLVFRYSKSIYYPLLFHIVWNVSSSWSHIWSFIYWYLINP